MDANRFDVVTRSLSKILSRRAAWGGVFASGLSTVLAHWRTDGADAKKKKKKKCKGNKQKCGKKCILKTECCGGCGEQRCCDGICADCCDNADCPTGATCEAGFCVCGIGGTNCGDTCADLITDGANCGSCGNACATGSCVNGTCTCLTVDDCPEGCGCVERAEGGSACATTPETQESCDDDEDCPLGAFCIDAGVIQFCSGVCQA